MPGPNDFDFMGADINDYVSRLTEIQKGLADAKWQMSMPCPNPSCRAEYLRPVGKPFNGHTQIRCEACGFKFTIRGEIEAPSAQEKKETKRETDTGKKLRLDMDGLRKSVKNFELK